MWPKALSLYFISYPIQWLMGVDGLLWVLLLPLGLLIFLRGNHSLLTKRDLLFMFGLLVFFLSSLLASLNIVHNYRYITWFRDTYLIATLLFVAYILAHRSRGETCKRVAYSVFSVLTFSCVAGLVSIVLGYDFKLHTAVSYVAPSFILDTDFGHRLFVKTLTSDAWFFGYDYKRLSGTFDYATSFAVALVVAIIFLISSLKTYRILRLVLFSIFLVSLFFTTSRASIISLFVGVSLLAFLGGGWGRRFLIIMLLSASILPFLYFPDLLHTIVTLRGGGSATDRLEIYQRTWAAIRENPYGYGSQVDIPELAYPLGSHSSWLALPFKFGILGVFGIMLAILSLTWFGKQKSKSYLFYAMAASVAFMGIFEEIYLDAMTGLVVATLIGVSIARRRRFHDFC